MNSYVKTALLALVALIGFGAVSVAYAQMASTMPIIYNQSGASVNTGAGYLQAGTYYLKGGPSAGGHMIEYYGNGTFYDSSVQQYGGNVSNPNGTAGVSLGYVMVLTSNGNRAALMPALYNSNGSQANGSTGYLNSGYYYLSNNPSASGSQVQYYGNGTYYNPNIGQYGGSVTNPNGTAGVSLGYSA
jgi:hypothetical protein